MRRGGTGRSLPAPRPAPWRPRTPWRLRPLQASLRPAIRDPPLGMGAAHLARLPDPQGGRGPRASAAERGSVSCLPLPDGPGDARGSGDDPGGYQPAVRLLVHGHLAAVTGGPGAHGLPELADG